MSFATLMVVDVIPLRKLPVALPFLSYSVPPELSVTVGSFVRVPFRRSLIDAIVWNINSSFSGTVSPLTSIKTPTPVISSWQHRIMDIAADVHATTPGAILLNAIPAARTLQSVILQPQPERPTASGTWWYTSRSEVLEQLAAEIRPAELTVILCSNKDAIDEVMRVIPQARRLDGDIPQRAFGQLYVEVAAGRVSCVVGTYTALFLPFPIQPHIYIDQEEQAGHQQTTRAPFLDARAIIAAAGIPATCISPAPSLRLWRRAHPPAPTSTQTRTIGRLDQGTLAPFVSAAVQDVAEESSQILWLLPRRGFAGSISCRDCGWVFSCHGCQRTMRWTQRGATEAACGFCGQTSSIPVQCPTCGSVQVGYHGFSDTKLRQSLAELSLAGQHTIAAYHEISHGECDVVIHAGADALLQYHDFAAEERAWQLVHRISAQFPSATHLLQTFQPNFPAWQYWATAQPQSWYDQALDERQRLTLPPACDCWVVHWRGADGQARVKKIQQQLLAVFGSQIACLEPPMHQKTFRSTPRYRIMISATGGKKLSSLIDWRTWFPAPWTIDTNPNGWLV